MRARFTFPKPVMQLVLMWARPSQGELYSRAKVQQQRMILLALLRVQMY